MVPKPFRASEMTKTVAKHRAAANDDRRVPFRRRGGGKAGGVHAQVSTPGRRGGYRRRLYASPLQRYKLDLENNPGPTPAKPERFGASRRLRSIRAGVAPPGASTLPLIWGWGGVVKHLRWV